MAPHGEAPLAALQSSARGWHGIQLAVLGFIGLCGVLQGNAGTDNPEWVRDIAAVLVLGSLVLACVAVAMVGTVAWPVDGAGGGDHDARLVKGPGACVVASASRSSPSPRWQPALRRAGGRVREHRPRPSK